MENVSATQWLLLCDPEVIRKLRAERTREERIELAERMEWANHQDFHLTQPVDVKAVLS